MTVKDAIAYVEDAVSDNLDTLNEDQPDVAEQLEIAWRLIQTTLKGIENV